MSIKLLDTEKNDAAAHIERTRRDIEHLIELARLVARLRFESYRAHIDAGFTEAQALELCKKWN